MRLRRAGAEDAPALARILLEARAAAGAQFPPPVHADDEMLPHLLADVLPHDEAWLGEEDGGAVGVLVLERVGSGSTLPDLIGQLSVLPAAQGRGVGSALLDHAKAERPTGLDLWVFTSNSRAQALYRRHGFTVVGGTDGDNEEGAPDLLMRWLP